MKPPSADWFVPQVVKALEKEFNAKEAPMTTPSDGARKAAIEYRDARKAEMLKMVGLDPENPLFGLCREAPMDLLGRRIGDSQAAEAHSKVQTIDQVCIEIRLAFISGHAAGLAAAPLGAREAELVHRIEVLTDGLAAAEKREAEREEMWKKYLALIGKENHSLVGLAIAHGWQGDPAAYRRGRELRAALGLPEPESVEVDSGAAR